MSNRINFIFGNKTVKTITILRKFESIKYNTKNITSVQETNFVLDDSKYKHSRILVTYRENKINIPYFFTSICFQMFLSNARETQIPLFTYTLLLLFLNKMFNISIVHLRLSFCVKLRIIYQTKRLFERDLFVIALQKRTILFTFI